MGRKALQPPSSSFDKDPNDEMVLEAAINGGANAIVTYNVSDFAEAIGRFGILVLQPGELVRKVKS